MVTRTPNFGAVARRLQAEFRTTLSQGAQRPNDAKGIRNPHLISLGHEIENLYPSIRGAEGALAFFRDRKIKWWRSPRSGDRSTVDGYDGPTRNLASSQIACVNFLLPLAQIPGALAAFLRCIDDDVEDVVNIIDQGGHSSQVEFEWVGWDRPLEGGPITRGAYQTSIDALLVARIPQGNRAYLCEWKYCEEYLRPEDKGCGRPGDTRRTRYEHLFRQPRSSFKQTAPLDDFFFEPFYQIMRLHLLADRMRSEGVTPELPIKEAKVIVVCPAANVDYRLVVKTTPLGQRFPHLDTVEDVVRAAITDGDSFAVLAPEEIFGKLRGTAIAADIERWLEYHAVRYGW
jgi:hypothetical protein